MKPWEQEDERSWLDEMWASVMALYRRYPQALERLGENWWRDSRLVELLSAQASWRAKIDGDSEDPREEIAFHSALYQLTRVIEQTPGGQRGFDPHIVRPSDWGKSPFA